MTTLPTTALPAQVPQVTAALNVALIPAGLRVTFNTSAHDCQQAAPIINALPLPKGLNRFASCQGTEAKRYLGVVEQSGGRFLPNKPARTCYHSG
jgi:hypothetical protein